MNVERGAASILIELDGGDITVYHGTTKGILGVIKQAPAGTWDALWQALEILGMEPN